MYCKHCGKWLEGDATLCADCAAKASPPPAPAGRPVPVQAAAALLERPAQQPAPPVQAAKPAQQAAPPVQPSPAKPAQGNGQPAPPRYYGLYARPSDDRPLNGVGVGGFVLSVADMIPILAIGARFAHTADLLYSFLFLFLPMLIFQSLAVVLSAIGLRAGKEARCTVFAKVGLIVAIVGMVMFVEMFIAGLVVN